MKNAERMGTDRLGRLRKAAAPRVGTPWPRAGRPAA